MENQPVQCLGTKMASCKCGAFLRVSAAVIKHCDQRQLGEGKVHFISTSTSQSDTKGSQGKISRPTPGDRTETKLPCCLLACPSWIALLLSYRHPEPPPSSGSVLHQWRKCASGQSGKGIFSVEASSFKMVLACVKVT